MCRAGCAVPAGASGCLLIFFITKNFPGSGFMQRLGSNRHSEKHRPKGKLRPGSGLTVELPDVAVLSSRWMAEGGFKGAARCCGRGLAVWEWLGGEGPRLRGPKEPVPVACPRAGTRPARPARPLLRAPAAPGCTCPKRSCPVFPTIPRPVCHAQKATLG